MTWPILLFGLLLASVAGWIFTAYSQRRRIRTLERSHEEIQVEETLVFDFLHGLGEAFSEAIRPNDLHRLIVKGATRILDAHGGALYMADRTGGSSRQRLSRWLPTAGQCSVGYLQRAATRLCSRALRLHATPREGIIGRVWRDRPFV
jgi:sigma-B regulation protein RsbU (phosphoserine phosphatase)